MSKFRILSFDGGGIKGLVELAVIRNILKSYPQLIEKADMISGTSTGGIIALCLASGMSVDTTIRLYEDGADEIFKRNWRHFLGLTGSKYKNGGLKKIANRTFGNLRLGDLDKKVLIASFDLMSSELPNRWKPKFFHNFGDNIDDAARCADVALYTSAAPTYFEAVDGYIDGGLIANNPSMAALCQAIDKRYDPAAKMDDISLLSLGTGESYSYIDDPDHNFGMLSVAKIVDILLNGTEAVPHYQCKVLLGDRYFRVNPVDSDNIPMDSIDKINDLMELGSREPVEKAVEWLEKNW